MLKRLRPGDVVTKTVNWPATGVHPLSALQHTVPYTIELRISNSAPPSTIFSPPLARQRYELIRQILQKNACAGTVVDAGCGEAALIKCLITDLDSSPPERIFGIDISERGLSMGGKSVAASLLQMHASAASLNRSCNIQLYMVCYCCNSCDSLT